MHVPTRLLFGAGQLENLHAEALPGRKAMIVISNGKSTRANGYLDRLTGQLDKAGIACAVFDRVEPNPLNSTVNAGGRFAREHGCDFIIALGGGSCMDAAKSIALIAVNDGDYWDYIPSGTGKGKPVSNRPLPIVAITTTAGTGSEADAGTVITNEKTHEKTGFVHPDLFPALSIVDPELMLTVPPLFTAFQGFDALFHSVEGYVSNGTNLMSDMYALEAIKHISRYLPRAVADGSDLKARTHVAFGNTLSGYVMCVGRCTSEHSLEHALSAYHQELPHGAGLIMISKAYFTHLIERHVADERFVRMAQAMGMPEAADPMDFITMLDRLQRDCGVSGLRMSDYGIAPEEFGKMARNARETMGFLFLCDRAELSVEGLRFHLPEVLSVSPGACTMSKKILIISSSPRKGGNSDLLCDEFMKGARGAGHDVEKVRLAEKRIGYCRGCGVCHDTHACLQKDDMEELLDKLLEADAIVLATPVYFYTLCGQMKTFIDRTVPRYLDIRDKEFYFILAAAEDNRANMERTVECFRGFLDCLEGAVEKGVVYGTGAWKMGGIKGNPAMKQARIMGIGV